MQVPHGFDHRHDAPREDAVRAPRDAVPDLDVDAAQAVAAVTDPGGRDRVRDERDASGRRPPDDLRRLLGEVVPVEDHLDDHVVARERRAGDARVAVAERPHRVEEVRDRADAAIERRRSLLRGRVGVTARDDDAALVQQVDELERAGQLGRERDVADRAGGEQPLEQASVRIAPRRSRVRSEPVRGEERAFEMDAEDARSGAARAGTSRSAAIRSSSGAVMKVGW